MKRCPTNDAIVGCVNCPCRKPHEAVETPLPCYAPIEAREPSSMLCGACKRFQGGECGMSGDSVRASDLACREREVR
jgi:hypothetical protein